MCPNCGVNYEGKYRADSSLPLSRIMCMVLMSYTHIYSDDLQLYNILTYTVSDATQNLVCRTHTDTVWVCL